MNISIWLSGLLLLYAQFNSTEAQVQIRGRVLDSITQKPIPYVSIGFSDKSLGTVADESGHFSLVVPDSLRNTSIKFSSIGYTTKQALAMDIQKNDLIYLLPEYSNLREIVIRSDLKHKVYTRGNETYSANVQAGFKSNMLGSELAIKVKIKKIQGRVNKFSFNIAKNNFDSLLFRLNIYKEESNGYPGENLLSESIFVTSQVKSGVVEVDLRAYEIFVDSDFFVSLEWIKNFGNTKGLSFSSKLFAGGSYFRKTSQDSWHKIPNIGIGYWVEMEE